MTNPQYKRNQEKIKDFMHQLYSLMHESDIELDLNLIDLYCSGIYVGQVELKDNALTLIEEDAYGSINELYTVTDNE